MSHTKRETEEEASILITNLKLQKNTQQKKILNLFHLYLGKIWYFFLKIHDVERQDPSYNLSQRDSHFTQFVSVFSI
jgi:hypothetical protein